MGIHPNPSLALRPKRDQHVLHTPHSRKSGMGARRRPRGKGGAVGFEFKDKQLTQGDRGF